MLRELGWILVSNNRDSPRNSEARLQTPPVLLDMAKALKLAMKRPEEFISMVFGSSDAIWVERCASIIQRGPRL